MKRALFIVAYDITCEKRRREIRKIVQAYSLSSQKSVFECWLTPVDKVRLIRAVKYYLDDTDLFHIFKTDQNHAHYLGTSTAIAVQSLIIH